MYAHYRTVSCSGRAHLSGAFFFFSFRMTTACVAWLQRSTACKSSYSHTHELTGPCAASPPRPTPILPMAGCALPPSSGGDPSFSHTLPRLLRHLPSAPQQVRLDRTSARGCPSGAGPEEVGAVTEKGFSQAKCDLFLGTEHSGRKMLM